MANLGSLSLTYDVRIFRHPRFRLPLSSTLEYGSESRGLLEWRHILGGIVACSSPTLTTSWILFEFVPSSTPPRPLITYGPQFGLKISSGGGGGGPPPGPSPGSATVLSPNLSWLCQLRKYFLFRHFERHTSTGSEVFCILMYLNASKFTLLSFFTLSGTICLRIWANPLPKNA